MELRVAPEGAQRTQDSIVRELLSIIDDMQYDLGALPYRVMRDEASGRSLFDNYDRMTRFLRTYRENLS